MKGCFYFLLLTLLLAGVQVHSAQTSSKHVAVSKYVCLPDGIKADTIVEAKQITSTAGMRVAKETVVQRLNKLKARCRAGKLRDQKGKEIRFYQVQGCWGNPPADYLEILEEQTKHLRDLKKKFTVIEITCNPTGLMPF